MSSVCFYMCHCPSQQLFFWIVCIKESLFGMYSMYICRYHINHHVYHYRVAKTHRMP